MVQTSDGYLWMGTRNGLARFDGVNFTVFDESTTPTLRSIQTVKLFEDSHRNLWIGTESSGAMLVTNGEILPLAFGEGQRKEHLVSICEDAVGAVWMLSENCKLARFRQGVIDVWDLSTDPTMRGRSVIAEKDGLVWVGLDRSLMAIDPTAVQTRKTLPEKFRPQIGQLSALLASRAGGYWELADGVITKWSGTNLVRSLGPYPWSVAPDKIRAACEDREGNLIVGTIGQGVFWFDTNGHAARICTTNGLANDSVLSMVADRDDNLWVGMDGGGAARRPLNRVRRSVFNLLENSAGLPIQSISEDPSGGLWFSPKDHDFRYLKNGVVTSVPSVYSRLPYNPKAVLVDEKSNVWGATLGVNLLLLNGGQFQPAPAVGPLNPEISALYSGHDGSLWVGTQGGLERWDGQAWQVYSTSNGLSANSVSAMVDDTNGNLWVGTENGGLNLWRKGQFSYFQTNDGFPSDNIACLFLDADGILWVGTTGNGLVRVEGNTWKHYTTQNGLPVNSIDYIIDDGSGYLWLGSNAGLIRLRKADLEKFDPENPTLLSCRSYDEKDGLPAAECTYGSQPAACRTRAGVLWFPTIAGMVSVDPASIRADTNPPPVVIESVFIDQKSQNTNGLRPPALERVTVPAGRENLEIHFTSLNLGDAARTVFRYRLKGYQTATNWTSAGKDRFVRYLNLRHGNYEFEVQARNEDGFWNTTGATLAVIVLPHFWQTWWFFVIVFVLLLWSVVAGVHFISTQKLQRQLADMRQQHALERERARIARDIHDQVGASLTQLSLLGEMLQADKETPAAAENHARQISQTARETARELDEIVWTVNPSNDTLDGLVNYICKNAQEYLGVAGLRYRVDVPAQLPPAAITPEARHNVFLAAKEAVTNVVRHAHASEAWLRLRLAEHSFVLEIEDNGRGPEGKDHAKASSRNGLRNMRKRMEDVGGEFYIGPGAKGGTLVRLTVPLRNR